MDPATNPFELGRDRLDSFGSGTEFIGQAALARIRNEGTSRTHVRLVIGGAPLKGRTRFSGPSADYSPRLPENIALAPILAEHALLGDEVEVMIDTQPVRAEIVDRPFYDPEKSLALSTAKVA